MTIKEPPVDSISTHSSARPCRRGSSTARARSVEVGHLRALNQDFVESPGLYAGTLPAFSEIEWLEHDFDAITTASLSHRGGVPVNPGAPTSAAVRSRLKEASRKRAAGHTGSQSPA